MNKQDEPEYDLERIGFIFFLAVLFSVLIYVFTN